MKILEKIEKGLSSITRKLALIGATFLLLEMFFTISNIAGRYLLNKPIRSTYEVCQLFMLIVLSLCWAYTEEIDGHVKVDIFDVLFPEFFKRILAVIMKILGLFVFAVLTWSLYVTGMQFKKMGSNTDALEIPFFPFAFLMALGALLTIIVMLFGCRYALSSLQKKGD